MMHDLIPVGERAWAIRSVNDHRRPIPMILVGEEVKILNHTSLDTKYGKSPGYLVLTLNDMQIYALAADFCPTPPVQPLLTLERIARNAFLAGYSEGHSRGLTCGRLYGADDQYGQIIQVSTRDYVRRLRGEDESDL